jgi:hypothetical protein
MTPIKSDEVWVQTCKLQDMWDYATRISLSLLGIDNIAKVTTGGCQAKGARRIWPEGKGSLWCWRWVSASLRGNSYSWKEANTLLPSSVPYWPSKWAKQPKQTKDQIREHQALASDELIRQLTANRTWFSPVSTQRSFSVSWAGNLYNSKGQVLCHSSLCLRLHLYQKAHNGSGRVYTFFQFDKW